MAKVSPVLHRVAQFSVPLGSCLVNRSAAAALAIALLVCAGCHPRPSPDPPHQTQTQTETRVQVIHFSDYHAHAIPFFSEHKPDQGGLARTLAYIAQTREKEPHTLAFSGGDMWNLGTPAWSDKYYDGCLDWKWLGQHVSVMALGNHDVDYGWESFRKCQKQSGLSVLSGNLVGADGRRLLEENGLPYLIKNIAGIRIGVFALSGSDFPRLVKSANLPPGASFLDPIATAKQIVSELREKEQVAAVLFIGHQDRDSDFALAKSVPGIDLIFGTHSHYKGVFTQIPGTQTYFISPYQYLTYLSHVELVFQSGKLAGLSGKLVKMDSDLPQDALVASKTRAMQLELERDPKYAPLFEILGHAATELDIDGVEHSESTLGNYVMDVVRDAAQGQVALSSASSFRAAIAPGPIRVEDYLSAVPYKNKLLNFQMSGAALQSLLDFAVSKRGGDLFVASSGARWVNAGERATQITVRKSATESEQQALRPEQTYTVTATDYLANIATGYKELFAPLKPAKDTGLWVNEPVFSHLRRNSPVSGQRDGRVR